MPANKSRVPVCIRERLAEALKRIDEGPSEPMRDPSKNADYNAGIAKGVERCAGWRHSWIEHELRQVLAWADGAETAHDIATYGAGLDYLK